MIAARELSKRYGAARALAGVDLDVAGGETLVVFGSNGAGKTTLLKILAGLLRPTRGTVAIDGREPRAVRGRLGYLGHDPYLYPHLTVAENLSFFAALYGLPEERAEPLLELLGLSRKRDRLVDTLSRGETQRAAVARAVLHDPDVLLVDEPFAGLDEASAATLPGILLREGRTCLIATHDVERGKAVADRIVTLQEGRLR